VLKEKQAWQALDGKWKKTYGFADGHAEIHMEPSGNFDDWESQHTISPPPNQ
jgi:prepilin-type processing-associated H-X9-DG protein